MTNHDFRGLHEYPEFDAKTGKGKKSDTGFPDSSSENAAEQLRKTQQLTKLTKTLAMGTVTALAVTGAVVGSNEALAGQVSEAITKPPISQNSVAPLDLVHTVHTWDEGVIILAPTCTGEGTLLCSCTGCDATQTEILPATGHTPAPAGEDIPATCTGAGRTADTVCAVCGVKLAEGAEIAPAGHVAGEPETVREATCTEGGQVGAIVCEVCGELISEAVDTEPLGHDFGDYAVTKDAACTEEGTETRTCARCGETESRAIAKLGHDWGAYTATKDPTCTAAGTKTRTCARCNAKDSQSIAKLGHTDENRDYRCDRCGAETVSISIVKVDAEPGIPLIEVTYRLSADVEGMDLGFPADFGIECKMGSDERTFTLLLYPDLSDTERTLPFNLIIYGIAGDGDSVTVLTRSYAFVYGPAEYTGDAPVNIETR